MMGNQPAKVDTFLTRSDLKQVAAIIEQGTTANTRLAYRKDLAYFWAWVGAALGAEPAYPVAAEVLVKFIVDHTGAMDAAVDQALVDAGVKQRTGAHSVSTITRRIASISMAHKFLGMGDAVNPCRAESVRLLLSKVRRAAVKSGWRPAKKKAATLDLLFILLSTCGPEKMIDIRDRALLYFAFSTGGRRRSEVAAARVEHLTAVADGYLFYLESSKTDQGAAGDQKPLLGKAGRALADWLSGAQITEGYLFRAITRGNHVTNSGIQPITVARIVQKRAAMAGLDPRLFAGHSLRSGFITEAGMQGKPMGDIMALSGHRTVSVVSGYYQAGNALNNSAAKLAG
jgi:integrase